MYMHMNKHTYAYKCTYEHTYMYAHPYIHRRYIYTYTH